VNASRALSLRSLPPILLFSLNRFEYDMATLQRVKLSSAFRYPLALDMRYFMEDQDGPEDWYDLFGVIIHQVTTSNTSING
jgi:ubiquitin carboxyl-terminal hydrolase 48